MASPISRSAGFSHQAVFNESTASVNHAADNRHWTRDEVVANVDLVFNGWGQ